MSGSESEYAWDLPKTRGGFQSQWAPYILGVWWSQTNSSRVHVQMGGGCWLDLEAAPAGKVQL